MPQRLSTTWGHQTDVPSASLEEHRNRVSFCAEHQFSGMLPRPRRESFHRSNYFFFRLCPDSESAIATACFCEVTFGPFLDPECNEPPFHSSITVLTAAFLPAFVVGFLSGIWFLLCEFRQQHVGQNCFIL